MKILHTTPAQDGFYMPAEFAPHEGCLMIWPERADSWQYGAYAARKAFLRVIETISESESMTVLCSEGQYDNARAQLPDRVRLVVMETDDAWALSLIHIFNHRFTLEVLAQDWKSHDLGISASNLRRDRKNPTDILDRIDLALVTDSLRKLLEIRNRAEQTVALDDVHAAEIKEYLDLLDLTREIDVLHLPDVSTKSSRTVIAQPGLRYAQADALIRSLLLDETFSALSLAERTAVQQRILTEIKGRMLEDIVLLETKLANPKKQVFVLQFPVGEFDMVVFDLEAGSCRIFEIKHSEEAVPQQYRHLIDKQKCAQTEHRYGPITGKFVLYRGGSQEIDGIQYQNVEEYLQSLA